MARRLTRYEPNRARLGYPGKTCPGEPPASSRPQRPLPAAAAGMAADTPSGPQKATQVYGSQMSGLHRR